MDDALTAHTPGQWYFWSDKSGAFEISAAGVCLAQRGPREHAAEESCATGRLLWAAPDMLAALYECEEYLGSLSDVVDGDYGIPAPNKAMSLLQEVRAALTKAGQP